MSRRYNSVITFGVVVAASITTPSPVSASDGAGVQYPATFITLGTNSGPLPNAQRMEPANVLLTSDRAMVIDAGDGAVSQLAKAGVALRQVDTVLISHFHFDHIGGLFALLSQRFQILVSAPLRVYGPPGTRKMVKSLCEAMRVGTRYSDLEDYGSDTPCDNVVIQELTDGASFLSGYVKVTAAANSHYAAFPGQRLSLSLSYRFDTPDRSIVYTGDTGPSAAVEKLAKGADLLVAEIMDPDLSLAEVDSKAPGLPPSQRAKIEAHFRLDHLSPQEVGLMAQRAGVKKLVLTHNALADKDLPGAKETIAKIYKSEIAFANDLDRF